MTAIASAHTTTASDSLLRLAMRLDAVLVGVSGVAILAFAAPLAAAAGIPTGIELALGAFFVLYGVVVFGLARLENVRGAGIGTVIANVVSTVAAVAVAVVDPWSMTTTGLVITIAMGIYTAVFAELQFVGVRRIAA